MWRNTEASYGSVAKFFHWLIFVLVVCMLIYGFVLVEIDIPKEYKGMAFNIHKLTGLAVLVLMLLRALWALVNPKPALPLGTPLWERLPARAVHVLLYLVLIAMPLVGWIGSVAGGKPPRIGDTNIGLPLEQNKDLASWAFEEHEIIAFIIIVLVSLHILAALFHYFIRKDNVLQRMLPHHRQR